MDMRTVLTVAGSDSSGGAGVQADLKTIAAHLLYGESVITALTAQNTCGVAGIWEVPADVVAAQMDVVFEDIRPDAVKVGMVSSAAVAHAVADGLARHGASRVVVDPVMVATSGADLMEQGTIATLVGELFPRAAIVTPNIPEASVLCGFDAGGRGVDSMLEAAHAVARLTRGAVLVKGGHLTAGRDGNRRAVDVLLMPGRDDPVVIEGPWVETENTHGTGCTLSSAIACGLACGRGMEDAVRAAKAYLADCLAAGLDLGRGNGPVDHAAPLRRIAAREDPCA